MYKISLKFIYPIILLACLSLPLASCKKTDSSNNNPLFIKAQNCYNNGNYTDAIKLYKRYLIINPDSAKANYQLASIYQEQEEYIQAIFFYEKYLSLDPNSSDKKIIEEWIESSKQQLLKKLEKSLNTDTDNSKEELIKELDRLKIKNEKMRDFILRHKDKILPKKAPTTKSKQLQQKNDKKSLNKISPASKPYTVQPGDTLYKISKKHYGTTKHYKLIMKANKKVLKSSSKLIPGYKLTIPPKP